MAAGRHRSRQRALQVLFQWDMAKRPVEEAIESWYDSIGAGRDEPLARDDFMEELAKGTAGMAEEIDQRIIAKAQNWSLERMAVVDRNILRLAIFEMTKQLSPVAVVIDEALELARRYSGDESVPFINGVLDAVNKEAGERVNKDAG
jgi:N utilization substance protein B